MPNLSRARAVICRGDRNRGIEPVGDGRNRTRPSSAERTVRKPPYKYKSFMSLFTLSYWYRCTYVIVGRIVNGMTRAHDGGGQQQRRQTARYADQRAHGCLEDCVCVAAWTRDRGLENERRNND